MTSKKNSHASLADKKKILIKALKERYKVQYDAVQPIPYIKDRLYSADKVFIETGVIALIGRALSLKKDVPWERLDSYQDIFSDTRMISTRCIIEGEPGYGKSTLTLQLAYDWCNDVEDSPLADVEILILLRLRQLGHVTSIYKAVKLHLLPTEKRINTKDIANILRSCPSVKILFDGYDEYAERDNETGGDVRRILRSKTFPGINVILTGRYIPKEYDRSGTKRVKLTGFDETAREQYIRKAVTGDDVQAVHKIKKVLKDNSILDELCEVPFFLAIFAHMANEGKDFQKLKSVTDFVDYMITCFHSDVRNKVESYNAKQHLMALESNHAELDKVAFECLSKARHDMLWGKDELSKLLGYEFYKHYIRVGILVEDEVFGDAEGNLPGKSKTKVRFYDKIICEWYTSFHVADIVAEESDSAKLDQILGTMDPADLQYVYRFACGINPDAGIKIIEYLMGRKDCMKFVILCILEYSGRIADIVPIIRELCSQQIVISKEDSKLLQGSTLQLLEIASVQDIPISDLLLQWSFKNVDKGAVVLHSGLCLPSLPSLEKVTVDADGENHDETDVVGLLNYGLQSHTFKSLCLNMCKLPKTFSSENIPKGSEERNIKVLRQDQERYLDLQSGKWKKHGDLASITELCSCPVLFLKGESKSEHTAVLERLIFASCYGIPIYAITLGHMYKKVDDKDVISLWSGVSLPVLTSLTVMGVQTEAGRELNEQDVNGILNYVYQSHQFKEVKLVGCLVPFSVSGPSLSNVLLKKYKVYWDPYGHGKRRYTLDPVTGFWRLRKDPDTLFPDKAIGEELSRMEYDTEVLIFRHMYSTEQWQRIRRTTEELKNA